eukprot:m.537193 g.537193  ORF g.537193 m.537193 type:complete len:814 (-) comp22073_c1_seq1:59-2500(-)
MIARSGMITSVKLATTFLVVLATWNCKAESGFQSPVLPSTCSSGQPGAKLPFCNRALGFKARAADLAARLNITEHVGLFFSYPGSPFIDRLNVKSWGLDHTCIHGLNKNSGVTVFPHAIAQGASWDVELVTRVSNATAIEGRIVSAQTYVHTGGKNAGSALSCDGGPLANSAHDPRWGRISETYGEDPLHIQRIGVTALNGLQSPRQVPGSNDPADRFFATRQVTRHYIAYHGGTGDTINNTRYNALYNASNRSLADSYLPTYAAFQNPSRGFADGIMCAMTELNGVPSCVNHFLLTDLLRTEWQSDAIIQTDCCDSLQTISNFGYKNLTKSEALALSVHEGLGIYFGYWVGNFREWMMENLGNGTILPQEVRAAGERVLLSFLRLGFFDDHAPDYPFHNDSIPWSLLDSPQHRALSREATAKSTVLLRNDGTLPLAPAANTHVAVVGPFAKCIGNSHKEANGTCYLHSYNGNPSSIVSIYDGIARVLNKSGASVGYAPGSNATCGWRCGWKQGEPPAPCWEDAAGAAARALDEAVAVAAAADVIVLALGLGADVEAEGCDRFNLTLPAVQQVLLQRVQAVAKKLILVVVSAGGVDIDDGHANAVLWAPYGGEEAGSGLADVLFGAVNPSAKLPLTFYKQSWFDAMTDNLTTSLLNLDLEVGAGRTHRYIRNHDYIKYHFGHGLSYTQFAYSGLTVTKNANTSLSVSVSVQNVGHVAGSEIVQVYMSGATLANTVTPLVNLVDFGMARSVAPAATTPLRFTVEAEYFETADNSGARAVVPGEYTVWACGHHPLDTTAAVDAADAACVSATVSL